VKTLRPLPFVALLWTALCIAAPAGMEIIAHRGAMKLAPENTLASQRLAYELGADVVEVDVRVTRDGVPVNFHDHDLERTTDGTGLLASLTLEQVKRLDAGSWFSPEFSGERVPTIAEVLEVAREYNRKVLLDVKGAFLAPQLVAVIQQSGIPLEQIAFLTWWDEMTAGYTSRLPGVKMMRPPVSSDGSGATPTPDKITAAGLTLLRRQKVNAIFLGTGGVAREDVDRLHAGGFEASIIYVSPSSAFYYQDLGVDSFWTDFADVTTGSFNRLSQHWAGWADSSGLAPDQRFTWMDPDGDGMTNLTEYALGSDPLQPGLFPQPVLSPQNGLFWALDLREDWSRFLKVTVQSGSGSGPWLPLPATWPSPSRMETRVPAGPGKKFYRLKFDLAP